MCRLALGAAQSVLGWFCECVAFWLVFAEPGWPGFTLFEATFVYALATLSGIETKNVIDVLRLRIFFDDQIGPLAAAVGGTPSVLVPWE